MKKVISLFMTIAIIFTTMLVPFKTAFAAEGADIVQCALEYVGKVPYVWGGENIDGKNPGADCSGFICRIYEKFGINMWANRTALRNCGVNLGTDMSVAVLGDIIWYEGHVAIYAGKDSKGNHMVVHETGGNIQNVAYTKHAIVNAQLKGIIRIPGVVNNGQSIEIKKATFSPAVDSAYKSKEFVTNTNACVVNQVTKLSGVKVTQMGLYLYDANNNLIKKYTENISNVGNSTMTYHSWYDINKEVGVTLTAGTTYKYAFFGIFDGQEVKGSTYSFKTSGTSSSGIIESFVDAVKVNASFTNAADPTYTAKAFIGSTNACVVTQVNKGSGVKVTQMGLYLYDANDNLIKKYTENISNVKNTTTKYHSWYDINSEVGVTLTAGTTYKYRFFGIFDGQEVKGSIGSFKTTGTAPQPTTLPVITPIPSTEVETLPQVVAPQATPAPVCEVVFYMDFDCTTTKTVEVEKGTEIGIMPTPYMFSGYEYDGFYTSKNGGKKVTKDTIIEKDMTLYPRYIEIDYSDEEAYPDYKNNSSNRSEIKLKIDNPYMYYNGKKQKIDDDDTRPFISNGRTLLPVRAVIEAMDGTVNWDGNTRTITLKKAGRTLFLKVDFDNAWDLEGNVYTLDAPPMIKNGRTMLPIRFVAEYFGATVDWDQQEQSVIIGFEE